MSRQLSLKEMNSKLKLTARSKKHVMAKLQTMDNFSSEQSVQLPTVRRGLPGIKLDMGGNVRIISLNSPTEFSGKGQPRWDGGGSAEKKRY